MLRWHRGVGCTLSAAAGCAAGGANGTSVHHGWVKSTSAGLLDQATQRHLNRPLAAWRRARAVELATQGHTYEEIASEVGYANRGTAYKVVRKTLDENVAHAVEEHREIEVARLNALQAAVWERAMAGDVEAVDAVLKIVVARVKLLGLSSASEAATPATVVVPASTSG